MPRLKNKETLNITQKKCKQKENLNATINQSIIYFNTIRQRAKKLVQNTNVHK